MLNLQEATELAENRERQKTHEASAVFQNRLKELHETDWEGRAICHYYMLMLTLRGHLSFETSHSLHLYENMIAAFKKQEKNYLEELKQSPQNQLLPNQIKAFYKMMEHYLNSLETGYRKSGFKEASDRVYLEKMRYRSLGFFLEKKWQDYLAYLLWRITSKYGLSFFRWGVTNVVFIATFGLLFFIVDGIQTGLAMSPGQVWYDYFYFSLVSFTTLGFGDITPITGLEKLLLSLEVISGYMMLGILVALLQKRL